jgi:hypothetical protein
MKIRSSFPACVVSPQMERCIEEKLRDRIIDIVKHSGHAEDFLKM